MERKTGRRAQPAEPSGPKPPAGRPPRFELPCGLSQFNERAGGLSREALCSERARRGLTVDEPSPLTIESGLSPRLSSLRLGSAAGEPFRRQKEAPSVNKPPRHSVRPQSIVREESISGSEPRTYWLHPSSFTYRVDPPRTLLQTLWIAHPGWGYIRRRDLWVEQECARDELHERGFQELDPDADEIADSCPFCQMLIVGVPGALMRKHLSECGGMGEDWLSIEDAVISDVRLKVYERKLIEEARRAKEEAEYQEKRERFGKIRQENLARQMSKDRKRRLREETREGFKRR